jgi:uncharacterized protein YprB with RNaseH-like and TPR domain
VNDAATLARRLARFRLERSGPAGAEGRRATPPDERRGRDRAERLAGTVGGEIRAAGGGWVVRVEAPSLTIPLVRERLATLPGQPEAAARLVCLDTETTGLGTGAGTLAFLVGLGWWEADRFRRLQLVCPDHGEEPALLAALEEALPPDSWLVTYNGRSFDWPLLVTRYRLHRRPPPAHAGMLDLLFGVRRLFRHRLGDARLATVERELLGIRRHGDVAGWEIPGRYLEFVRGGSPSRLAPVLTHNAEDLAALARLLAHLDSRYADPCRRPLAPAGDLLGLARAFARERRHEEALVCLEEADRAWRPAARGTPVRPFGGTAPGVQAASRERLLAERARTLRRLGRLDEALAAWAVLAHSGGPAALAAWIETAKLHEHALGDLAGALRAALAAGRLLENRRLLGRPDPAAEAALAVRRRRLLRRLGTGAEPASRATSVNGVAYPGSRDRLALAPRTNPP